VSQNKLAKLRDAELARVTEHNRAEDEARVERNREEARYRNLVERVPVGLYRISTGGDILEANPAMVEMLGFQDADSLKRAKITELWLHAEERARLVAIIEGAGVVQNFELGIRRRDGSIIWCEESARAVYDLLQIRPRDATIGGHEESRCVAKQFVGAVARQSFDELRRIDDRHRPGLRHLLHELEKRPIGFRFRNRDEGDIVLGNEGRQWLARQKIETIELHGAAFHQKFDRRIHHEIAGRHEGEKS